MSEKPAQGFREGATGDPLGSLAGCAQAIRTGAASPLDVVREALARIEAGDPALNSLVTVNDRAEAEAHTATEEIRGGRLRGPLHGVPVVVKDVIDTAGMRTTMGTVAFTGHRPEADAEVVRRLKEAGAVIVGKANTDAFAAHATGTMSFGGPVRNPADPSRITGGSSGGTAAALAAGFCVAGIGTDTGGSIRIPAALCGVVGMKPTYGLVGSGGLYPLAPTLDHVGPMSRTVEDNALVLNVIAGHDSGDPVSARRPPEDYTRLLGRGVRGGGVAVLSGGAYDETDPAVGEAVAAVSAALTAAGASLSYPDPSPVDGALDHFFAIVAAEVSDTHAQQLARMPAVYPPAVRDGLRAYASMPRDRYAVALRERDRVRAAYVRLLADADVLLCPTVPVPAPPQDARTVALGGADVPVGRALIRFTGQHNLTGLPCLTVPFPGRPGELPVGVQLIGRPFDEAALYRYGHAVERELTPPGGGGGPAMAALQGRT
ncbi:amidase [Streptomyces sp. NPDC004609]|uniref:amidase n=1 Tax=Streptomyces sp. NPDC004609 TaxID=3364704 RepID=UPI0036B4ED1F